jgi:peptidoglycan hydrolase-like protein with peptidoglycan-binding domain
MKASLRNLLMAAAICTTFLSASASAGVIQDESSYSDRPYYASSGDSLRPLARSDVGMIQQRLADRGYYNGQVDGLWGPRTTQSVSAFQAANDLPSDGKLTHATLDGLGLAANDNYAGSQETAAAGATYEYEETITTSEVYTTRGKRGFSSAEFDAQGSTCLTCRDGIYGHGGKPSQFD